jgi:radical SAM protein with 4Fe4S-binding SPASM domain
VQTKGTRDGRGIVFVGHDGTITPSGFLPLPLGNVRDDDIVDVYRDHPLLRSIRAAEFGGRCGACAYRDLCGGSRARAYATHGDPLAEDPACAFSAA